MERHLAWLVALIVVLTAWFGLLCCGATAKKKAAGAAHRETAPQLSAEHTDPVSVSADGSEQFQRTEQIPNLTTERCICAGITIDGEPLKGEGRRDAAEGCVMSGPMKNVAAAAATEDIADGEIQDIEAGIEVEVGRRDTAGGRAEVREYGVQRQSDPWQDAGKERCQPRNFTESGAVIKVATTTSTS